MDIIYQLTFYLALALLAILITVFVFAVSLLGRALETAARDEREKLTERKESNAKTMVAIKKDIDEAEAKGDIPVGLIQKLKELKRKEKKYSKELKRIRKAPELLTVEGGVVPPGAALLIALVLSGWAWGIADVGTKYAPITLWLIGLVAVGFSIVCIYKSLKIIESVAITSEAEAERRLTRAVKGAWLEVEEEKKPELQLEWKGQHPPFHMKVKSEITIQFILRLRKGDIARHSEIYFTAPQGFKFPDARQMLPPLGEEYINYVAASVDCQDILKGKYYLKEIKLKAPSQPKCYPIIYSLGCEGFNGEFQEFKVIVE